MIYYTETHYYDHDKLMNSLSKGRDDYFEVLRRMGLKKITIPTLKPHRFLSVRERIALEAKAARAWEKAVRHLGKGDTLVIHTPNSEKHLGYAPLIKKLRGRGCKVVTIVFELETFFTMEYRRFAGLKRRGSVRTERELFECSDAIVVHNDRMKKMLTDIGIDGSRMFSVGIMDYLRDEPLDDSASSRISADKPVAFAGNLSYEKSQFEYALPDGFRCNLYGSDYTGPVSKDVCYKGVFDPMSLMDKMEGSFGLVWDGDSVDACSGQFGDYLVFNNPHKIAVYLASGMPVIVWDRIAMADFVRRENCGIAVRTLREVPERISALTHDEYEEMRLNACRVGREMRKGVHIRSAVEKALESIGETVPVSETDTAGRRSGSRNALIIFTREPVPGETKTRLMPQYTPEQCAELHECFLRDIERQLRGADADIFVAYTGGEPKVLSSIFAEAFESGRAFEQQGSSLGEKMENAFRQVLATGTYDRAVLTGTDIPELRADTINDALKKLDSDDIVLGPTADGGYYLIGMKEPHHEAFDVKLYGTGTVYEETAASIRRAGLTAAETDSYHDIDEPSDADALRRRLRDPAAYPDHCTETREFLNENARISVIIPVYNEEAAVDGMLRQMIPSGEGIEVIFVDGGSTDDTCGKIERAKKAAGPVSGVKLIHSNKGRGVQMNAGAAESSGDILFFLHCDSVLPDDYAGQIRSCIRTSPYGCFGVRFPSRNIFMLTNRLISNHRAAVQGLPFGDQGIFMDRELFIESGGFPEIPLMEDYELSLRLRKKGLRPAMTQSRIETSARRYGNSTASILKTELMMWRIRRLYRMGAGPEKLADKYLDVR